jgi:dinuclear metal center YbgI/SA1388 family protein
MAVNSGEIVKVMEALAPAALALEKDPIGLQMGSPEQEIHTVLISLELNEAVLEEAVQSQAQMILVHHTPLFVPVKDLREDRMPGRMLARMLRHRMCLYCAHTNLDIVMGGVNDALASRLGLQEVQVLCVTYREKLTKLVAYVPVEHVEPVRKAMAEAGAGWIGDYSDCAFMAEGYGFFRPGKGTHPYIGREDRLEKVREARIETVMPEARASRVVSAMLAAHPYEEAAYDLYPLDNYGQKSGVGRIGNLPEPMTYEAFASLAASRLSVRGLRCTGDPEAQVRRIALCGGRGAFLIEEAKNHGAQVFLTADVKHHEAQDALEAGLFMIDAGHFSTEQPVIEIVAKRIREALPELRVVESGVNTDPFWYVME